MFVEYRIVPVAMGLVPGCRVEKRCSPHGRWTHARSFATRAEAERFIGTILLG